MPHAQYVHPATLTERAQNSVHNKHIFKAPPPPFVVAEDALECHLETVAERFDCHPEENASETSCLLRRCCWGVLDNTVDETVKNSVGVPRCFFPKHYLGYSVQGAQSSIDRITVQLKRRTPSGIDVDVPLVQVQVLFYDRNTVRIKVLDPSVQRFSPPVPSIRDQTFSGLCEYGVNFSDADGKIRVYRLESPDIVLFQTDLSRLVFTDQFLQLSTTMPSSTVFGLGEQWSHLRRDTNWTRHVFFNRDRGPVENENLYGTHPVYFGLEQDGKGHGVFLHNSNAMEVFLQPTPAATFRAIGGILDMFVFVGPSPTKVVQQLQHVVGFPAMPPYWGLGFHLCRFDYGSLNRTRFIMEKNIQAGIPLDTQWNDIDYMNDGNDFTYDPHQFRGLPEFVDELQAGGRHYVIILDPAVSGSEPAGTYPPYDRGMELDVFVKNASGSVVYGKVWNANSSVFPDFSHPRAEEYWISQFKNFHDLVPFDGAWIDMNEPSVFYNGHAGGCPEDSRLEHPPYVPGGESLSVKTLCMSDRHHISAHYDVHNIYGHLEARATYKALATIRQKRPFVISRATSAGQAAWSGHWSGDIESSWKDLRLSVPNVLSFGLYGIPLVGADICGFNSNTTVELCARWQALGAFYPFSRNHNTNDAMDQDPYSMGPVVLDAARSTLMMRYTLLPYLYTLFYRSHVLGETVARPLFMEFPQDPSTYDIDEQFLWGPGLMFNPALYENQTEVNAYVPAGVWFDLDRGTPYHHPEGRYRTFPSPLNVVNILVRGGFVVPGQEPALTTTQSRQNPIVLLAAPDIKGTARGELFWDDGDSIDTVERNEYNLYEFLLVRDLLHVSCHKRGFQGNLKLGRVVVYGVSTAPASVTIEGTDIKFDYNETTQMLSILNIDKPLDGDFVIKWS
ncbi:lysosomal alpha-glucosidase-like [Ixodes scapularis]|uniref:lysosomal alpha-glucosidase-like n=1 Tax=Ixodes scapularis TaxID=6945 RepID=UPI001A9F3178|nr:lysosomal alpha-glucosidase-like [Ixodes scapularis]